MSEIKQKQLQKFMLEYIKNADLNEDQDKILFAALNIIKANAVPQDEE